MFLYFYFSLERFRMFFMVWQGVQFICNIFMSVCQCFIWITWMRLHYHDKEFDAFVCSVTSVAIHFSAIQFRYIFPVPKTPMLVLLLIGFSSFFICALSFCLFNSVKTEILEKGANSSLFIAKIDKLDSGNYTCSINASHSYTVSVHVLNGKRKLSTALHSI